jgi:hypothetical protein
MKPNMNERGSFWNSLPGVLTGCGAAITAIAALIGSCAGGIALFSKPPASSPTAIVASQPDTNYIVIEKIQLPDAPEISEDIINEVKDLIVNADIAEINAVYFQDDSYLDPYYAGQALQNMQQYIEDIRQSRQIVIQDIDLNKSYYANMKMENNVLSIDMCEYWQTYYYDLDGNFLNNDELTLVPQTISIESVGDEVYITAISFYQNNAFCTK